MNICVKDFDKKLAQLEVEQGSHVFLNGEFYEWNSLSEAVQQQYSKTVADLQKTILDALLPLSKPVCSLQ